MIDRLGCDAFVLVKNCEPVHAAEVILFHRVRGRGVGGSPEEAKQEAYVGPIFLFDFW